MDPDFDWLSDNIYNKLSTDIELFRLTEKQLCFISG